MSFFLLKNFQDLNNPFSLLVPFLFSLCGRWFSRDNKKKMQHRFSRHSTFSEQPSSLQTKCVQTFYQDRHGAKFEDKCFVQPRSWKKKKKVFHGTRYQAEWCNLGLLRSVSFDICVSMWCAL